MNKRNVFWQLLVTFPFFVVSLSALGEKCPSSSSSDLDYQYRGDRCEGVLPKPVSNYDIELLSAVAYREPSSSVPQKLKLRFFSPDRQEIHLKIHDLEDTYFYLMDKVRPQQGWQAGINSYEWDTGVIKALRGLEINKLGVLVRLGYEKARIQENIAPVLFYYDKLPSTVSRYAFTFKTSGDVKLEYFLNDESKICEANSSQRGGQPFTVSCNIPNGAGNYELVAKGYFVQDNTPVRQSVRFHAFVLK